MRLSPVCAMPVLLLACRSLTAPIGGTLTVSVAAPVLKVTNDSHASVYVFPIEARLAELANWAPCADPSTCRAIKVGATEDVAYGAIAGYTAGATDAIIYWWHLVPGGQSGFKPDSIRGVPVKLQ